MFSSRCPYRTLYQFVSFINYFIYTSSFWVRDYILDPLLIYQICVEVPKPLSQVLYSAAIGVLCLRSLKPPLLPPSTIWCVSLWSYLNQMVYGLFSMFTGEFRNSWLIKLTTFAFRALLRNFKLSITILILLLFEASYYGLYFFYSLGTKF